MKILFAVFYVFLYARTSYGQGNSGEVDNRNGQFSNVTKLKLETLLSGLPNFTMSLPIESQDEVCARHSRYIIEQANHLNLWALKFLDSTAKLPSGIFNGNIRQIGDYDECLEAVGFYQEEKNNKQIGQAIRGKYCLAEVEVKFKNNMEFHQDMYFFTSNLTQPHTSFPKGHNIAMWGICVPSSCSAKEVETSIKKRLGSIAHPEVEVDVLVEEDMCKQQRRMSVPLIGWLIIIFLATLLGLCTCATLLDDAAYGSIKDGDLVNIFSLKKNLRALLNTSDSAEEIEYFAGMKFLLMVYIIMYHKLLYMINFSCTHKTPFLKSMKHVAAPSLLHASDALSFITGTLAAKSFLKDLSKPEGSVIPACLIRPIRILPMIAVVILTFAYVLPYLGDGPFWGLVMERNANMCQKYWWRYMLFVNHRYPHQEVCLINTHQYGYEMELYLFSGFLVYLMHIRYSLGLTFSIAVAMYSFYLRYSTTQTLGLSVLVAAYTKGLTVDQTNLMNNTSYSDSGHRACVFVFGMLFGYYLQRKGKLSKNLTVGQVWFMEIMGIVCLLVSVITPYYVYYEFQSRTLVSYIEVLSPLFLAVGLVLITLAGTHKSSIFSFLKWRVFKIVNRLSFSMLLVHTVIQMYTIGFQRSTDRLNFVALVDLNQNAVVLMSSILLTLFVDLPSQNIARRLKSHIYPKYTCITESEKKQTEKKIS